MKSEERSNVFQAPLADSTVAVYLKKLDVGCVEA